MKKMVKVLRSPRRFDGVFISQEASHINAVVSVYEAMLGRQSLAQVASLTKEESIEPASLFPLDRRSGEQCHILSILYKGYQSPTQSS